MATNPNDPAFPDAAGGGLTKREYFAAMAMQGMLAHDFDITPSQFANDAVIYAEALIKELSK